MIQRIQTLYLLLAAALLAVTIFTPIATFAGEGGELTLAAFTFSDASGASLLSTKFMGILLACAALLPLVVIFLYKRRQLQIRLCGVELVLLLGCIVFECIYCHIAKSSLAELGEGAMMVKVGAVMPLVAIVLTVMAMRGIFRDEILVRSLDRIR